MKDKEHHHEWEEQFTARDRKRFRKERREATLRDRSKYKKSDQDQLKKSKQAAPENLPRGRVLAITPEGILVDAEGKIIQCVLKGTLKQERARIKNLIAVGDFVHFEPKDEKEGSIAYVEERRSVLSRAEHHMRQKEQLIAVNIDQVLITTTIVHPNLKPALIDRYIIAAEKGNMTPVIVINKIDLLKEDAEKEIYAQFCDTYRALGLSLFPVSATTGEGMEALKKAMQGKASVFSGQSGVGKSSLINMLTGASLEVGRLIAKTQKGAHTTTSAHLIPIEGGGFCIDTPGIKSFGLWDLSRQEIQAYFREIQAAAEQCRFPDCHHLHEPDCAVQRAVELGKISPLRFASYCALMADLDAEHKPR